MNASAAPEDSTPKPDKSRDSRYYDKDPPDVPAECRELLEKYSGVAPADVVRHVQDIRDKAWDVFPYPCIGFYSFATFRTARLPYYAILLADLKAGKTLLDLGCLFGADVRKLVFDGAPAAHITAADIEPAFFALGHAFFRDDAASLPARFVRVDVLDPTSWRDLAGQFDYVTPFNLFHLFSWTEQVVAMKAALAMLRPQAGSTIIGNQFRLAHEATLPSPTSPSGEIFGHTTESFRRIWDQVASESGYELDVAIEPLPMAKLAKFSGREAYHMRFEVVLRGARGAAAT